MCRCSLLCDLSKQSALHQGCARSAAGMAGLHYQAARCISICAPLKLHPVLGTVFIPDSFRVAYEAQQGMCVLSLPARPLCSHLQASTFPWFRLIKILSVSKPHYMQVACAIRVSLAPVLPDLPFIGGIGLSILNEPYLDFDLRCWHASNASQAKAYMQAVSLPSVDTDTDTVGHPCSAWGVD